MRPGEFISESFDPLVTWQMQDLAPPSPVYITRDDWLAVFVTAAQNNTQVQIVARLLTAENVVVPIAQVIDVAVADNLATGFISLAEGFLLSVSAIALTGGTASPCFVHAILQRGGVAGQNNIPFTLRLLGGYVGGSKTLSWPSMEPMSSQQGPTEVRVIVPTPPAAGAEISVTVPVPHRWRVHSIMAHLLCSAAVATRRPVFSFSDGASIVYCRTGSNQAFAASSSSDFVISGNSILGVLENVTQQVFSAPIPTELVMGANFHFTSTTTAIQAGDQWSAIALCVEDLYEDM
jgi:hypothetical protein